MQGSAREILAQAEAVPEEGGALAAAQDWLRDFLAEGPQPQREIMSAADAFCHSRKTVRRAKAALGIESRKMGGTDGRKGAQWFWHLPGGQDGQETQDAQHREMGTLAISGHVGSNDTPDDAEDIEL